MTALNPSQTCLAAGFTAGLAAIALNVNGTLAFPFLLAAPATALTAVAGVQKNGMGSVMNEVVELSAATLSLGETETQVETILKTLIVPKEAWSIPSLPDVDFTTEEFWSIKRAMSSKLIVGSRGSGKSTLARYFAGIIAQNAQLIISDRHFVDEPWLPGVPDNVFREKYLVDTAEETLEKLVGLARELKNRIDNKDTKSPPVHLMIDEWGGCYSGWSKAQQQAAIKALTRINEEGRKYGTDVSLILHALTKDKTGIDQAIAGGSELFLTGDALSNTTWSFPSSLSAQSKQLNEKRTDIISEPSVINQRIVIHRHSDGEAQVVITPDLSNLESFTPVFQEDLEDAFTKELEKAYEEGMSSTKLSKAIGITNRKLTNPNYVAVKDFIEGKKNTKSDAPTVTAVSDTKIQHQNTNPNTTK